MVWDKMFHSEKVRESVDAVTTHPLHKEYRHTINRFVLKLRRSEIAEHLYALQGELLETIRRVEVEQQEQEQSIENVKVLRKELVEQRKKSLSPDKYKFWDLARQESEHSRKIEVFKQVRRELRSVGDGMLWKAVGYDRGYIIGVSDGPGEGNRHLSDPQGLEAELNAVERFARTGTGLAILHDVTNIGRIGDLTLVSPSSPPRAIEVKRSQSYNNQRIARQEQRLREMRQFIQGMPVISTEGYTKRLRVIDAPLKNHLESYAEVLFEAGTKGVAGAVIDDYMAVVAHYTLHTRWDYIQEVEDESMRERLYRELWETAYQPLLKLLSRQDSLVIRWASIEKEFSSLDNMSSGAPFSIYPFNPELCAALICGYMQMFVFYDLNALAKRFQQAGFQTRIEQETVNQDQVFPLLQVSRPKLMKSGEWSTVHFNLNRPLIQQILGEGMAFETLLNDIIKPVFRGEFSEHNRATAIAYRDESSIWNNVYNSAYMRPGTEWIGEIEL